MGTIRQNNREIYWAWKAMKQRVLNPKCKAFPNYGGRGIDICDDWLVFEPFCEWAIRNGWKKGLDLDRIDNNKGYSPENCHWTSRRENVNNRRVTIYATIDGITRPISYWADSTEIPKGSLKVWAEKKGIDYVEARIKEAIQFVYIPKDYGRNSRKSVTHESGIKFCSVREAAKAFDMAPCTISNAIKMRDGNTKKGRFTWDDISNK